MTAAKIAELTDDEIQAMPDAADDAEAEAAKALPCPGMPEDKHGRVISPGEIITFYDVGDNVETWNRLVDAGKIQLDRDISDPGRPTDD